MGVKSSSGSVISLQDRKFVIEIWARRCIGRAEIQTAPRRAVEDALGVIGGRFIDARAATGRCAALSSLARWAAKRTSASERDEAEDGLLADAHQEYSLDLKAGVLAILVGGVPKARFQSAVCGVFFRWGNPVHEARHETISLVSWANLIASDQEQDHRCLTFGWSRGSGTASVLRHQTTPRQDGNQTNRVTLGSSDARGPAT